MARLLLVPRPGQAVSYTHFNETEFAKPNAEAEADSWCAPEFPWTTDRLNIDRSPRALAHTGGARRISADKLPTSFNIRRLYFRMGE